MPDNFRVKLTRGTTAQNNAYTGEEGEVTLDMEKNVVRIHDGVTQGGTETGIDPDSLKTINGESIVGTGNITIGTPAIIDLGEL